jgi:hypothetical protein
VNLTSLIERSKLRRSKSLLSRRQSWRSKVAAEGPGTPSSPSADIDVAFRRVIEDAVPQFAPPTGSKLATSLLPSLPIGWHSNIDAESGSRYYINTSTGTSQWEIPSDPAVGVIAATWAKR